MAQYALLISAPYGSEAKDLTTAERAAHDRHADKLAQSGGMVAAFALEPADSTATSVRGDPVTDGPFVDAKEVIAGFCVIEAPDLDAAASLPLSREVTFDCTSVSRHSLSHADSDLRSNL